MGHRSHIKLIENSICMNLSAITYQGVVQVRLDTKVSLNQRKNKQFLSLRTCSLDRRLTLRIVAWWGRVTYSPWTEQEWDWGEPCLAVWIAMISTWSRKQSKTDMCHGARSAMVPLDTDMGLWITQDLTLLPVTWGSMWTLLILHWPHSGFLSSILSVSTSSGWFNKTSQTFMCLGDTRAPEHLPGGAGLALT